MTHRFHITKKKLDSMPDSAMLYARRGAPWTFDAELLVQVLHEVKEKGYGKLPSFDHSVGDPVEDDIVLQSGKCCRQD